MDFIKSAASFIAKAGSQFPYDLNEKIPLSSNSVWTLQTGSIRESAQPCSVFSISLSTHPEWAELADRACETMKTLRHPCIIKYLSTYKSSTHLYIATETVRPVTTELNELSAEIKTYGLWRVSAALSFLNDKNIVHGNLQMSSVYLNSADEWIIGDFFLAGDSPQFIKDNHDKILNWSRLVPFEIQSSTLNSASFIYLDSYELGKFISHLYNGTPGDLSQRGNIPANIFVSAKKLLNVEGKQKLLASEFLKLGERPGGFFRTHLITLYELLSEVRINEEEDRVKLKQLLSSKLEVIPKNYIQKVVLNVLFLLLSIDTHSDVVELLFKCAQIVKGRPDIEKDFGVPLLSLLKQQSVPIRGLLLSGIINNPDVLPKNIYEDTSFSVFANLVRSNSPTLKEHAIVVFSIIAPKVSHLHLTNC